jgi:hypothetical protein
MTEHTRLPSERDYSSASWTSGFEIQSQYSHTCWISSDCSNPRAYTTITPDTRRTWSVPPRFAQGGRHRRSRRLTRAVSIIRATSLGSVPPTGLDADLPTDSSWKRS